MGLGTRAQALGPAALWFPALALLVAGPLLGSGYLLLLDWPSGPQFPAVNWFPLPSSGDIGNNTLLNALHAGLRGLHQYLPDKLFLLAPLILGGIGLYHFARRRLDLASMPALYGGTLFVLNPFVLDRYLAGHLHFLLAYSLLPWSLLAVHDTIRQPSARRAVLMSLWLFGLAAIDLHVAGMYAFLATVGCLLTPSRRRALYALATLGLAAVLSAYWLLPAMFAPAGRAIGDADLAVYATRPRGVAVLPKLAGMYGFWRDEFVGPAQRIPALYLLLVPILGLVVVGLVRLLAPGPLRRFAAALGVVAGVCLILASGTSFPPTAAVFRWLFHQLFVFRVYREPQKFLALVLLAYAVFGAAGLDALLRLRPSASERIRVAASSLIGLVPIGLVIAYGYTMLWGFWGQTHLSSYPDDWQQAERVMEEGGRGKLLVLPWNLYAVWTFSDGRIAANPAPSFFYREALTDKEAGFTSVPAQSADPFTLYIDELLDHRDEIRLFGHLVAPIDVRYVALLSEVDHWEYGFLQGQPDLEELYLGRDLRLFENLAWKESPRGLSAGQPITAASDLFGSEREAAVTERLLVAEPGYLPTEDTFPAVLRRLPSWRQIALNANAPYVLTGHRCSDGWMLGNERAHCHLGAAAAFAAPTGKETLWHPLARGRLLGFLLSILTLVGKALYVRRNLARQDRA